jgi:hypothetical protein
MDTIGALSEDINGSHGLRLASRNHAPAAAGTAAGDIAAPVRGAHAIGGPSPLVALLAGVAAVMAGRASVVMGLLVVALEVAALLMLRARHADQQSQIAEVQLHLARLRRLEAPADVLAVVAGRRLDIGSRAGAWSRAVAAELRLTDSVQLSYASGGVCAVLDGDHVDHATVERRLGERVTQMGFPEPQFGWARFPEDGFTYEVLAEVARGRATATRTESTSAPASAGTPVPVTPGSGVLAATPQLDG